MSHTSTGKHSLLQYLGIFQATEDNETMYTISLVYEGIDDKQLSKLELINGGSDIKKKIELVAHCALNASLRKYTRRKSGRTKGQSQQYIHDSKDGTMKICQLFNAVTGKKKLIDLSSKILLHCLHWLNRPT